MNKYHLIILTICLSGCGRISGSIVKSKTNGAPDFQRSEVISSGTGIADGTTEYLIAIQLMNSDGSIVALFLRTSSIVSIRPDLTSSAPADRPR